MESVLSAFAIYLAVLVLTRLSGRRTLGQLTAFDFVLLVLISETTQGILVRNDNSLTNAVLLMSTLILTDVILSLLKDRVSWLSWVLDGTATVLVRAGMPDEGALRRARVDKDDILSAARKLRGISRMEDIALAVLEASGEITIVPVRPDAQGAGRSGG